MGVVSLFHGQLPERLQFMKQSALAFGKDMESPFPSSHALAAEIKMPGGLIGWFLSRDATERVEVCGLGVGNREAQFDAPEVLAPVRPAFVQQ